LHPPTEPNLIKIIDWYAKNQKKLPWRGLKDPYKIWISEIILQQTRIAQGMDYYKRFIKTFPNIESLALSQEEEVLKMWQGLGYYSRARNIHFAAKYIYRQLNGIFPTNFTDLLQLKGIGKYTAAAIASIAYSEPVAAIDGNAFRVYSRFFSIELDIAKPSSFGHFFALANQHIDKNKPGDFNQAVMDLGSTICLPKNPQCKTCPLNLSCKAFLQNQTHLFPVKSKKTSVQNSQIKYLFILDKNNNFFLRKRDSTSIWGNMFDFPQFTENEKDKNDWEKELINQEIRFLFNTTHLLTHKRLHISFFRVIVSDNFFIEDFLPSNFIKTSKNELHKFALPKPIENFLNQEVYL
jgi:A/G-specific adenine glycosylase